MVVLCCIVVVTGFLPFPVSRSSLSSPPSQVQFQSLLRDFPVKRSRPFDPGEFLQACAGLPVLDALSVGGVGDCFIGPQARECGCWMLDGR